MRDLRWQVGEAALIELEELVADPDLEAPLQDVDRLLLLVVHVQRGPAFRCDFDGEVVEGATGVLAGDLEDEVSSRAGLQPQTLVCAPGPCAQRWCSSSRISYVNPRVRMLEYLQCANNTPEYLRMSSSSGDRTADRARPRRDARAKPVHARRVRRLAWHAAGARHGLSRARPRRLQADHGFGVDAYGVLITLVSAPGGHAHDRGAG